ncbi:chromatin remodeling complex Adenosinetriphosphatase [Sorochytrium milnesiophthora]
MEDDSIPTAAAAAASSSALMSSSWRTERKQASDTQKAKLLQDKLGLDKRKAADTLKRYTFLLGQTDIFRHFIKRDISDLLLSPASASSDVGKTKRNSTASRRHRTTEVEEDKSLLDQNSKEEDAEIVFTESPPYVCGTMRDYQVHGLNWMISLFENGVNGILADEMGLGKTLQTISFLGYLKFFKEIPGPHLVVVPKTTLHNWKSEFAKWVPEFKVLLFHGDKEQRAKLVKGELLANDLEVCVASYEMCLLEKAHFKKISWSYIVIDEAHRIKNENSLLSQIVRLFNCRNRLLLTGTPLQNNLHELWALLNFLLPDVFSDAQDFEAWFEDGDQDKVEQLQKVLRPFLLRRVKADVEKALLPKKRINLYVGLTDLQKTWYKRILEKNLDAINVAPGKNKGQKTRLLNIVMQLRKCCNHPYLFDGAEPGPPYTTDKHLVDAAGKMIVLDTMLLRFKAQGSRVLIFSQMSRVLDILEDYCGWREFDYCRIDGQTAYEDRVESIDAYNAPNSRKFIFLLTTRAGGLGINLTTADIVVMYDNDWNPQVDLQAEDRAHRIGQTKQVYVYRFVTDNTIEEKVIERATQKLQLDKMVIQNGRLGQQSKETSDDFLAMIRHGADALFQNQQEAAAEAASSTDAKPKPATIDLANVDVDEILRRSEEKTAELAQKYANAKIEDLLHLEGSAYEWGGEDYRKRHEKDTWGRLKFDWIGPSKRERKANYDINEYYRNALKVSGSKAPSGVAGVTAAAGAKIMRQYSVPEHQFFPPRYLELVNKAMLWELNQIGYQVPKRSASATAAAGATETMTIDDEADAEQEEEQRKIDKAEPLTEEEEAEEKELYEQGFTNWTKREFHLFLRGCEKHGRNDAHNISLDIEGKTVEDVRRYQEVFWQRYKEIPDWEKKIAEIEKGEEKINKILTTQRWLDKQLLQYREPMYQLKVPYNSKTRTKQYTEYEDRFLLVSMAQFGLHTENLYETIRKEIATQPRFRFDWFLKSRSTADIARRCAALLSIAQKEMESSSSSTSREGAAAVASPAGSSVPSSPVRSLDGGAGDERVGGASSANGKRPHTEDQPGSKKRKA